MDLKKHKLSDKVLRKSPKINTGSLKPKDLQRVHGVVKKLSPSVKRCQMPTSENPKRPKPKKP